MFGRIVRKDRVDEGQHALKAPYGTPETQVVELFVTYMDDVQTASNSNNNVKNIENVLFLGYSTMVLTLLTFLIFLSS